MFDDLKEAHTAEFIGLVLTPVPALVGFDSDSICRRIRNGTGTPAVTVRTDGYRTYHDGLDKVMDAMFSIIPDGEREGGIAVLGFTPLEYTEDELRYLKETVGGKACFPGDALSSLSRIRSAERNILISSSAVPFARMMEREYGIPYTFYAQGEHTDGNGDRRILIIGEQVRSNIIRQWIRRSDSDADVATFFTLDERFSGSGDVRLNSEDDVRSLAERGYECVIGDPLIRPLFPDDAVFIPDPHAAVSSRLFWNDRVDIRDIRSLAERAVSTLR